MVKSKQVRPAFLDIIYFSMLNYWAAHKIASSQLKYLDDGVDDVLYELLRRYTSSKTNEKKQGEINPSVCAIVIYQDMINAWGAISGYLKDTDLKEYKEPDGLLEILIESNIQDEETAAVLGGIVLENVGFSFPTAANFICSRYKITEKELLSMFLPTDFSDLENSNERSKRGSRVLGALGAALLGPVEGAKYAEVLAIKQSVYGGWGKLFRVRAKVNSKGYPIYYSLDEVIFATEDQIRKLHDVDSDKLLSETRDSENLRPDLINPVYLVHRSYRLKMPKGLPKDYDMESLLKSRLILRKTEILHPEDVFDYVHKRRQKNLAAQT